MVGGGEKEEKKEKEGDEVCDRATLDFLRRCKGEVLVALDSLGCLPLRSPIHSLPGEVRRHHGYAVMFRKLGEVLEREMEAARDKSLEGENRYVLETVEQVRGIEVNELDEALKRIVVSGGRGGEPIVFSFSSSLAVSPPSSSSSSSTPSPPSSSPAPPSSSSSEDGEVSIPRGFVCPISLEVMNDPVIAADGHSYERSMIEVFFFNFI